MNKNIIKYIFPTLGPLLAGIAAFFSYYSAFIVHNVSELKQIQENSKILTILHRNVDLLNDQVHTFNLKIEMIEDRQDSIGKQLQRSLDYQQVLRKEVKEIAENKLNISEFWHIIKFEGNYVRRT